MGFATISIDQDFARRSSRYLADHGCTRPQIVEALVDELDLSPPIAVTIADRTMRDLLAA